jgi:hypothetical protein
MVSFAPPATDNTLDSKMRRCCLKLRNVSKITPKVRANSTLQYSLNSRVMLEKNIFSLFCLSRIKEGLNVWCHPAVSEKYHMRLYSRAQFGDLQELRKGGNPLYFEVIKAIKAACFPLPSSIFLVKFFHFHLVPERSSEGLVGLKRKSSPPNPAAPFLFSLSKSQSVATQRRKAWSSTAKPDERAKTTSSFR